MKSLIRRVPDGPARPGFRRLMAAMLVPTLVVAVVHVLPLFVDTSTISPETMFALVVPEIVCAPVLVLKSVPEVPVSAENASVAMVVVGAVVSST